MPFQEIEMQVAIVVIAARDASFEHGSKRLLGNGFHRSSDQIQGFTLNEVRYCKVLLRYRRLGKAGGALVGWGDMRRG
jgi:hypothetical protein